MTYCAVQLLEFSFSDDRRGSEHAERRARIRGLPIAAIEGGVFQRSCLYAWTGYEPRSSVGGLPWQDGAIWIADILALRVVEDRLLFAYGPRAMPWENKVVLQVPRGSWARAVLNGKAGNSDVKWLNELVVNAGAFAGRPPGDIFLGKPVVERDLRHDFLRNGYRAV
jgi:hypothetical protein